MRTKLLLSIVLLAAGFAYGGAPVSAEELNYCGNYIDDDGNLVMDEGEPQRFINIKNKEQIQKLMAMTARAVRDHNNNVGEVLDRALTNFAQNMQATSAKSAKVDPGKVFLKLVEKELIGKVTSKIPDFPGSTSLILFKYHSALQDAMKVARDNAAERAAADIVIGLNSKIAELAIQPLESKIIEVLHQDLVKQAKKIDGELTGDQIIWGAELCVGLLDIRDIEAEMFPDGKPDDLIDATEVTLYESWIRSRYAAWDGSRRAKLDGVTPPSVEVRFKATEGEAGIELEQVAGVVNDPATDFGERIAARLDELTTPWNLNVPIRACLQDFPGAPGPKCGLFDPKGKLIQQPSVKYRLAIRFLGMPEKGGWKTDMNCIDPYRKIGAGSCAPDSWY